MVIFTTTEGAAVIIIVESGMIRRRIKCSIICTTAMIILEKGK
jgi:hypothetical protein